MFQNLLTETDRAVLSTSQTAWTALLHAATRSNLQLAVPADLADVLFSLACIPTGMQLPQQHIVSFPMPAGGNDDMQSSAQQALGAEEGSDVASMRLAVAGALGQLAQAFSSLGQSLGLGFRVKGLPKYKPLIRTLNLFRRPWAACPCIHFLRSAPLQ